MPEEQPPTDAHLRSVRRWRTGVLLLAALFTLLSLWALLHAPRALDASRAGSMRVEVHARAADGWWRVRSLQPGSPLEAAGVRVGDQLRFRYATDAPGFRAFDTEERIELATRAAGESGPGRSITVQPVPDPDFITGRALFSYLTGWTARFISLALGVLIVLRQPQSVPLRGLALGLLCSSVFGSYFLPGGLLHDAVDLVLRRITDYVWALGLLWFALGYPPERPLWRHRAARLVFAGLLVLHAAHSIVLAGYFGWGWSLENVRFADWFVFANWNAAFQASQLATLLALWLSCRRAEGAQRTRLVWVTVAMVALQGTNLTLGLLARTPWWPQLAPWQFAIIDLSWLLGAVLLVWAVLRHRAFDIGLVMQRTLALSVVSTGLLTALGLGKWITERLLHQTGLPHGLWSDLLVALAVVAAFASVQRPLITWVDARVFRRWHEAARALRAFVDRAAQITDPAIVQQRFVAAVDAFAEAQGAALYLAEPDGGLRCMPGTLARAPALLDANDPLAIELRHGTRRVDLTRLPGSAASTVAEWAFAMTVRGRVSGLLLLSPRPDGVAYRPEELAQLEDSARLIGLDLESLRVDELERGHALLQQELAEMRRAAATPAPPVQGPDR